MYSIFDFFTNFEVTVFLVILITELHFHRQGQHFQELVRKEYHLPDTAHRSKQFQV